MDIGALLPLLLNKTGTKNAKMNTLLQMAQGGKPDIGTVMNMAMENRNEKNALGLKAVSEIASHEIMGKLAKYFLRGK